MGERQLERLSMYIRALVKFDNFQLQVGTIFWSILTLFSRSLCILFIRDQFGDAPQPFRKFWKGQLSAGTQPTSLVQAQLSAKN